MVVSEDNPEQVIRSDEDILSGIWDELWQQDTIRCMDMYSLSVNVKDGEVFLNGHLAAEVNLPLIDRIAYSIRGVTAVHNNLVRDHDLIIQVAQALCQDERTRPFILRVEASHGLIRLLGHVPTRELQLLAEQVAGQVPSARGIIALPKVAGSKSNPERHAVQPEIGASVYGKDGLVGVVTQVVIQPRNRLVTHIAVSANELRDGKLVSTEFVVPVEAIDLVNKSGVSLMRNAPSLSAYPTFDPGDYPLAPLDWQPPYPYTAGTVRWSSPKLHEAGKPPFNPSPILCFVEQAGRNPTPDGSPCCRGAVPYSQP
jgi:osmotically-inducible protein OsmY/sporulation protein YlmC with PRC-barrel domain